MSNKVILNFLPPQTLPDLILRHDMKVKWIWRLISKLSICWSFWPCYFWLKPAASGFNMLNYWLLIFFINFVFGRSWPEYNFDEAFLAGWGDNGRGNDETLRESVMKTCMALLLGEVQKCLRLSLWFQSLLKTFFFKFSEDGPSLAKWKRGRMICTILLYSLQCFIFSNRCKNTPWKKVPRHMCCPMVNAVKWVKLTFLSKKCIFWPEKDIFSKTSFSILYHIFEFLSKVKWDFHLVVEFKFNVSFRQKLKF